MNDGPNSPTGDPDRLTPRDRRRPIDPAMSGSGPFSAITAEQLGETTEAILRDDSAWLDQVERAVAQIDRSERTAIEAISQGRDVSPEYVKRAATLIERLSRTTESGVTARSDDSTNTFPLTKTLFKLLAGTADETQIAVIEAVLLGDLERCRSYVRMVLVWNRLEAEVAPKPDQSVVRAQTGGIAGSQPTGADRTAVTVREWVTTVLFGIASVATLVFAIYRAIQRWG